MSVEGSSTPDPPRKKGKGKKKDRLPYTAQLNSGYQVEQFKQELGKAFTENVEYEHGQTKARLHDYPFKWCSLPKFVQDDQFLEGLRDELAEQIFYEKSNDLYKFQQSDDLKKIHTPHVRAIRKLLYEEFLDWITEVTGIDFGNKVDLTCSKYDYTDILLCHDDELEGRRIAFILYLVPPWKEEDGGTLDLFDMDEHGQPKDIVKSLIPERNKLVFFEVTPASHHQVSEILTEDKTRLSINGWFHGPDIPRPARYIEPRIPTHSYKTDLSEEAMLEWINPIYLTPDVQGQIQEKFETDSEIELQGFLREEKYYAVVEALREQDIKWTAKGPPNKRSYHAIDPEDYPDIIQQCLHFLQSEHMFLTLSNLTGLTLHPLVADTDTDSDTGSYLGELMDTGEESNDSEINKVENKPRRKKRRRLNTGGDSSSQEGTTEGVSSAEHNQDITDKEFTGNPRCRSEVRKWSHGSYTLLHDTDMEASDYALDTMLFCSCKGWQPHFGGGTSYIAKGEDEELLTVAPAENSLALVYRDKDTLKFVKHLNEKITDLHHGPQFYDFSVTYYE